jgi:UDP-N-acetylglucosamine--N-acetylmuramyl-(pentapeptide) pyrophosphoryl-undecaprenol N-acetylglucosamine transferase
VAAAYRARRPDATIVFLGPDEGPGPRLVPAAGHRWLPIGGAPFFRVSRARSLLAASGLVGALPAGRRVLRTERIELVLGLGSYATAAVVLAGRTLGLATAVHEANAVGGLANRLVGRAVDRILLGFADAARDFPAGRSVVTGNPVRSTLHAVRAATPDAGRAFRLLVTGGSRGSAFLDAHVPDVVRRLVARGTAVEVRHQAGDVAATRAAYARAAVGADVVGFFDVIDDAYAWADFAITCAGAGTLAELATVRLPALLVPLAVAARDHQTANARAFAALTGTPWTSEREFDPERIAVELAARTTPARRAEAAQRLAAAAATDAAGTIVAACEALRDARRTRRVSAGAAAAAAVERRSTRPRS